jgi:hypothetical protein
MITSDEDGSGANAPPPLITNTFSSIMKKKRQYIKSIRQLTIRCFDAVLVKYEREVVSIRLILSIG